VSQDINTARMLKQRLEELSGKTPYGVFDLWEGCGREQVRKRFYELVKENHPDRYGGNIADIRESSQEIFLLIKAAYGKLLTVEGVQTVAERPSASLEESSGARRDILERLDRHAREAGLSERSEVGVAMPNRLDLAPTAPGLDESSEVRQLLASRLARRASLTQQIQGRQLQSTMPGRTTQATPAPRNAATAMDEEERRAKLARLAQKKSTLFETNPGLRGGEPIPGLGVSPVPASVLTRTSPGLKKDKDLEPKDLFNEGYQRFKMQRYDEALEYFQRAKDGEAGNGLYMTFHAYCTFLVDASKRDEVEKLLREALQSRHRQAQPDAHLFLGYVLKTKGKLEEAQRHFEASLELNPTCHDAEREIRLHKLRKDGQPEKPASAESAGIFKKLFKK
jgi:tetratricopeptide (TPR) repeat protein